MLVGLTVGLNVIVACLDFLTLALVYPALNAVTGNPVPGPSWFPMLADLASAFNALPTREKFRAIAIVLIVLVVARGLLSCWAAMSLGKLTARIESEQRTSFLRLLLSLELSFLHRFKGGELFAILSNFTVHATHVMRTAASALPAVFLLAVYSGMLLVFSPGLTVIALGVVALSALAIHRTSRLIQRLSQQEVNIFLQLSQTGYEFIMGLRLIKAFGRERLIAERYSNAVNEAIGLSYRKLVQQAAMSAFSGNIAFFVLAIVLLAATFLIELDGSRWGTAALMYLAVMGRLMGPLQQLNAARTEIAAGWPYVQLLAGFRRDAAPHVRIEGAERIESLQGDIVLDDVSFSYKPELPPALQDVSIRFERGRTTAIIGASGSGKSTIVNLLVGLYRPTSGAVLVNGRRLDAFDTVTWQEMIGVVSQDVFLLNDTVLNNIRFGRPSATPEECQAAAEQANAHDFIMSLERGYDTVIGDRGLRLSGGQAQRLSLARVFVKDPPLLILDEATSALDSESERLVQSAIELSARKRTVVMIAHRLSTVRGADKICVIEGGRLVEEGTHDALVRAGGHYERYLRMQEILV